MFKKELPEMSRITSFSKIKENMKKKKRKYGKQRQIQIKFGQNIQPKRSDHIIISHVIPK